MISDGQQPPPQGRGSHLDGANVGRVCQSPSSEPINVSGCQKAANYAEQGASDADDKIIHHHRKA
jgi:hypothetical protein